MPVYDRVCHFCDWRTDFSLELVSAKDKPCPKCGAPTDRVFIGKGPLVVPDTFSTPLVDDVMLKHTQVFHSRSEHRHAMQLHGYENRVRHVSGPEGDKSKHTTSWLSGPPAGFDPRPFSQLSTEEQAKRHAEWEAM